MFAVLALFAMVIGMAGTASAATPMYVLGKYTQVSFGNDTTTGTTSPFYSTNYLGIPFGQDCNAQHGSRIAPSTPTASGGTTSLPTGYQCFATSTYPSAHAGSPLVGSGVISVSASPGGAIALPQSLISVKLGSFPTAFNSPIPPFTSDNFAKQPVGGVPGGSFSYYPPYIYSYSYADLKNEAGNFFAGGGPGNFVHAATAGGTAAGTLTTTAGSAKFGGTMGLLGSYNTHFAYSNAGGSSIGTDPWLISWLGNGTVTAGTGMVGVLTTMSTGTNKHNVLLQTNTKYVTASAFPWTTGVATARATRGPFFTNFARSGYDNRTAAGAGNIQLVSPMLTHWRTPAGGVDYETASIGKLTLTFAPEPSSAMLLVAGVSLLGLVYRGSRGA
ncbi:MAG: hypothetical protein P8Q97_12305 [Myxococcota bacterium]|nr:hypothetical protein [Myxococcota bacterium]